MEFTLTATNKIRGDQLVDEIARATGIDLTDKYGFYPPNKVQVPDALVAGREAEIQAIVDVHEPDPLYFPADVQSSKLAGIEQDAEVKLVAIPGWSTWTEQEALDWYTANVTDLIDAIPDVDGLSPTAYANNAQAIAAQTQGIINAQALVIRNMTRMLLALRNKVFPNLEGG